MEFSQLQVDFHDVVSIEVHFEIFDLVVERLQLHNSGPREARKVFGRRS